MMMEQMIAGALLIGIVAGLRAFTAPVIASWAAVLGVWRGVWGWVGFMEQPFVPYIFTVLALGEMVTDQLPSTPSRKVPIQFGVRILMGALAGATIGAATTSLLIGLAAGAVGAVIGTLGGAAARGALARMFGNDHPAAFLEDAIAIGLGVCAILVV
jgi:uncharacterized membrane protein